MADGSNCGDKVLMYPPNGDPFELDPLDLYEQGTPQEEVWQEVSRETSTVNVSGVDIQRIDSVTFDRGFGKIVTLNFNN